MDTRESPSLVYAVCEQGVPLSELGRRQEPTAEVFPWTHTCKLWHTRTCTHEYAQTLICHEKEFRSEWVVPRSFPVCNKHACRNVHGMQSPMVIVAKNTAELIMQPVSSVLLCGWWINGHVGHRCMNRELTWWSQMTTGKFHRWVLQG